MPASGTEIIKQLGAEHVADKKPKSFTPQPIRFFKLLRTKRWFPLERLYEICEIARQICARRA
jgi:phosphopentomutase